MRINRQREREKRSGEREGGGTRGRGVKEDCTPGTLLWSTFCAAAPGLVATNGVKKFCFGVIVGSSLSDDVAGVFSCGLVSGVGESARGEERGGRVGVAVAVGVGGVEVGVAGVEEVGVAGVEVGVAGVGMSCGTVAGVWEALGERAFWERGDTSFWGVEGVDVGMLIADGFLLTGTGLRGDVAPSLALDAGAASFPLDDAGVASRGDDAPSLVLDAGVASLGAASPVCAGGFPTLGRGRMLPEVFKLEPVGATGFADAGGLPGRGRDAAGFAGAGAASLVTCADAGLAAGASLLVEVGGESALFVCAFGACGCGPASLLRAGAGGSFLMNELGAFGKF